MIDQFFVNTVIGGMGTVSFLQFFIKKANNRIISIIYYIFAISR